jgi:hypothetical protein
MRFLSLALVLAGCVGGSVGVEQSAIVGGTNDSGDPAVVLIIIGDPNGNFIYMCTGEVVSPHVVLTAGHCTNDTGPYNVYLGTDINRVRPSELFSATPHPHPQYRGSEHDIGVLVLDNPVPNTITPLPFSSGLDPSTLVGQSLRLVGYGSSGSLDPSDTSAGVKRQVTSPLSAVDREYLMFDDVHHNTCEGDSGGPALAMVDGVETIVGVTSIGVNSSPTYCDGQGWDTRVDVYASFVQPFIDKYDPAPPPQAGQPGATGSSCNSDDECFSKNCTGANGYCTSGCDPNQADSCPSGLHCQVIDATANYNLCQRDAQPRAGGCSVGGFSSPWALLLPLLLLWRRRFSS